MQFRLALAPIVICGPVAREFLDRGELHALGLIRDGLLFGPLGGRDAATEVVQVLFRYVDAEGADSRLGHGGLLSVARASCYTQAAGRVAFASAHSRA